MSLSDDQQRVRRIMTAVLTQEFDLARTEISEAPDKEKLCETAFMLMEPIVQIIAGMNGIAPQEWWNGLMLHMESQE